MIAEFGDITIHIDPKSSIGNSDDARPIKGPEKWHLKEWSAQGGKNRHESVCKSSHHLKSCVPFGKSCLSRVMFAMCHVCHVSYVMCHM